MQQKKAKKHDAIGRWNNRFKRPEARPSFPPSVSNGSSYEELPLSTGPSTDTVSSRNVTSLAHANTFPRPHTASSSHSNLPLSQTTTISEEEAERQELESALAASMSEPTPRTRTSTDEDEHLAAAIRASVSEFQAPRPQGEEEDDEDVLHRAITASLEEASKHGASEEDQKLLEEVLRKSTLETRGKHAHGSDSEWDSDEDTEDDENYKRIIAESKEFAQLHQQHSRSLNAESSTTGAGAQESGVTGTGTDDEEDFRKALAASEAAERERQADLEKQRTEEDIVMEYVKKQSLAEEEHRRRWTQGRDVGGESSSAGAGPSGSG